MPALIWGLDARTWTFTDEREYGLWMAKPRWHKILAQAGLELVCEHWCAFSSLADSLKIQELAAQWMPCHAALHNYQVCKLHIAVLKNIFRDHQRIGPLAETKVDVG